MPNVIASPLWWLIGLLALCLAGEASAQALCDKFSSAITVGPMPVTQRLAGVADKKYYLCGYSIMRGAQDLEFELSAGKGVNCATDFKILIPRTSVPGSGIVNRQPFAGAGEYTALGDAVCLQTWGNTGATLTSTFYWAQF
jgi:hypothetical protein